MKNILKIVFLGVVGFSFLVYLTVPKNMLEITTKNDEARLSIDSLPKYFELVGTNPYTKFETLFKKGIEKYIIVLNHDALAVFKDLYKKTDKNIVLVANISNTPWLIKQLAVNGELEKIYKESKIPLIVDGSGSFVKSLFINNNKQNQYFIYKLQSDGKIMKIKENSVKEGALEKGLEEREIETYLNEIVEILK
jgi:hypothetical protein